MRSRHRIFGGLLVSTVAAAAVPAAAMQFQLGTAKDGTVYMVARGEIHQGDLRLFRQALAEVPPGSRVSAVLLDSSGGNLVEGEKLAAQIRASDLTVVVGSDSQCASACFLLLAASSRRIAGTNALVGVHSASVEGKETLDSMAMTLQMQRIAGSYGVPPAIIGKMAQTTPGRVEWLTHADLASMNVRIIDDTSDAQDQGTAQAQAPARPAAPSQAAPTPVTPPMVTPAGSATPAVAEFQGALFCQQGTAKLSLRVVDSTDSTHHTAMFKFEPMRTGQQLPSGAFMMQGQLELSGGGVDLRPTEWVSAQPRNFAMMGLTGRSDDGGKTFAGHATVSQSCSVFTMKRMR